MPKRQTTQRSERPAFTRRFGFRMSARTFAVICTIVSLALAGCVEQGETTELIMSDGGTRQCAALGTFVQLADFVVAHDVVTIEYVATTGDAERGPATQSAARRRFESSTRTAPPSMRTTTSSTPKRPQSAPYATRRPAPGPSSLLAHMRRRNRSPGP